MPARAQADSTVVVLGITSVEGDDELARNLTGAVRNAAGRVDDWQVSDSEVTLAQMSLAHGCSDEPDTGCLAQIASTLGTQLIVYGILRRASTGRGVTIALSLYDTQTGHIERSVSETIPSSRTDIDDLRDPARRLVAGLSGPQTGALHVTSNVPDATVRIDGEQAGTTDSEGAFESATVPVGEHTVEVSREGYQPWTGTVTIATGHEMTLDAQLEQGGGGGGGGGIGALTGVGIGLLGLAAASFGVAVYTWVRIDEISRTGDYGRYRDLTPVGNNVCADADANVMRGSVSLDAVRSGCSEGATLEIVQAITLIAAAASAGAGVALIVIDGGSSSSGEQAVTLTPSIGPDHAYLGARIAF
jgi:hypothetical protein